MTMSQHDPLNPPDAVAFFRAACQAFRQAEQAAGGTIDRVYRIGGYPVRLRFAGAALIPRLVPALAHHEALSDGPPPALSICLWDSASLGTRMPPPPWSWDDYRARGEVRGYNDGHISTAFAMGSGVLSLLDASQNLALYWVHDARQLPAYESGAPLLTIFSWWMGRHDRQLVHAGAVGLPAGGVLLAGRGGTGKSTTALSCLHSPLSYVSDDYCLLATKPGPYAYSLYNSAKLDAESLRRLPHLAPALAQADQLDGGKTLLFLRERYPDSITTGFPVRAILLSRVTGRVETTVRPASPTEGLKALAPSTIFQLSGAHHAALQTMAQVVKQVPCYHLELGTEVSRIPEVIAGVLSACNP
ncbi:MAG: serine kinase [Candidatus Latescibacteria bacterium]|nr:serine kinase [Candidatus Latescibacterota bacterium]